MNELRQKRKDLEITQLQAANVCGVSLRTYQTYEETHNLNETYNYLLKKLDEMGVFDGSNCVVSVRYIKQVCRELFKKYPQIKCAYLYGSYARGEATGSSDVDILLVCHDMGMEFFGMAADLQEALHKEVDLQTHDQIAGNEDLLENILVDGIKIYG